MRNFSKPLFAASLAAGFVVPCVAFGQEAGKPADPSPSTVAGAAGSTQPVTATPIVVRGVKGKVTHRTLPDGERKTTKAGDVLSEGTEVSTGINSGIELQVGTGQVFTIDRVSRVILREAIASQGKEKTTVAVPYGRVQFEVSSATVANDVQIQAPDATLAVKGTSGGVEVSPGFPTLAFGGDFNKGVFDVAFEQRIVSTFRGSEKANTTIPSTAKYALEGQFVDINDVWSHDGDEQFTIRDFQTILFLLLEIFLRDQVPEAPFDVFFLNESSLDLYRADVFGTGGIIGSTSGGSAGRGNGLALTFPEGHASGVLFRLETGNGTPELLMLDLADPTLTFQSQGFISSFGALSGLGALGTDLYTLETSSGLSTIDRIEVSKGFFANPVMDLGVRLEGDLAGVTPAGVLFVAGRLPTIAGFSNGTPGILGADGMLVSVDPRINYLSGAVSTLTTDLSIQPDTRIEPGITSISAQRVTGVSLVVSALGDPILLITTQATVNNASNVTLFNIFSIDAAGNTHLTDVGRSTFTINALASESRGTVPASPTLAAAPSPSQIDTTPSQLFAELAYSQDAVNSGVMERLIANQIVQTAIDPTGCAASSELHNSLSGPVSAHIDQHSGAGAAMFDFRAGLPSLHPCAAPGAGPSSTGGSSIAYFYFDEFTGDLHTRNAAGADEVLTLGQGELKPVLGSATTPLLGGGGRSLFTLTNLRTPDGAETPTLTRRDLSSAGTVGDETPVDSFGRVDLGGGRFRSFQLNGLAGLGNQLFTSGRSSDQQLDASPLVSETTVYELLSTIGTPVERMVLPMDLQSGALAGAGSRGTIFALGNLRDANGGSGTFRLAGAGANAVLLELDPRNNYLVAAQTAQDGSFQVQSGTSVTGGADPTSITHVTGMAYVGDTLVMSGTDSAGRQTIVQYLPNATNTPSDPRMRRLNGLPEGAVRVGELGGESIGPVPASRTLSAPTSPVDLVSINRTFAQLAYSSQAAGSSALRGMVREHIANTAIDPAGCRASAELNGPAIPGFLNQHVDQQSGVGQTVFQFRSSLPANHPCRPRNGG